MRSGIPRNRSPWGSRARVAGRRIWDIGDWGSASERIGIRWEELALPKLEELVRQHRLPMNDSSQPERIVRLAGASQLQAVIAATGLQNPDAIVIGRHSSGDLSLRSVDFKWSLETAGYRQISAEVLRALVEAAPEIREAILEDSESGLRYLDGLFFAPDNESNRDFLASEENRRQEWPITLEQTVLAPVDVETFFGPLDGWPLGVRLAELDRATNLLRTLDGAERYYRLGAGVQGALITLNTSLFAEEPPTVAIDTVFAELRQKHRLRTTPDIIAFLGRRLAERSEWLKRLRHLWRTPYSLDDLLKDLQRGGVTIPAASDLTESAQTVRDRVPPRWLTFHKAVAQAHRASVNAAGRDLVAQGLSEAEAIMTLERRRRELASRTRQEAHRELEQILRSS